jgi:hypothetical protein
MARKPQTERDFAKAQRYLRRYRVLHKYSERIQDEIAAAYVMGLRNGRRSARRGEA